MPVGFIRLDGTFVGKRVAGCLTVFVKVGNGGADRGRADIDAERQPMSLGKRTGAQKLRVIK